MLKKIFSLFTVKTRPQKKKCSGHLFATLCQRFRRALVNTRPLGSWLWHKAPHEAWGLGLAFRIVTGLLRSVYEDQTWLWPRDNCCLRARLPLCVCPDEASPTHHTRPHERPDNTAKDIWEQTLHEDWPAADKHRLHLPGPTSLSSMSQKLKHQHFSFSKSWMDAPGF